MTAAAHPAAVIVVGCGSVIYHEVMNFEQWMQGVQDNLGDVLQRVQHSESLRQHAIDKHRAEHSGWLKPSELESFNEATASVASVGATGAYNADADGQAFELTASVLVQYEYPEVVVPGRSWQPAEPRKVHYSV